MVNIFNGVINILPNIKQVISRFPVSFVFIQSLTVISLLLIHNEDLISKILIGYTYFILGFGAIAHVAFKLYVESNKWTSKKYFIGILILTLIVSFYAVMIFDKAASSSVFFFSLALALSWMFTPYIFRTSNENSVWYFNYQTGVALFFGAVSAVIFGGGLSLLLLSVGYLFEFEVPSILYGDIWIITWGVLFTNYVLANISKTYDFEDESCEFPKGISFIANYILVPLMYAYIAVLYAYFMKIIVQWELPKGNLGWMISAFGVIGIATKLIAFPICQKGTRLMTIFDRYFYYALILPVIMLFVAIFMRINAYGVTEQRYMVVLLGILFSIVIIAAIVKRNQFHIKHVPMILAVLAIFAAYGPWSGVEVSFNSQAARFKQLLIKYERLKNGQAVTSRQELSFDDRKSISSIADYLMKNKWRKKQVLPMFEDVLSHLEDNEKNIKSSSGRNLLTLLNIEYVGYWRRTDKKSNAKLFSYSNHVELNNTMMNVSGYDFIGRNSFYIYNKDTALHYLKVKINNKLENIKASINKNIVIFKLLNKYTFTFDLNKQINTLRQRGIKTITKENAHLLELSQTSQDGKLRAKMIVEQISGESSESDKNKCNTVKYVLMLDFIN